MPCSKCKQAGHNARSCSNEIKVQETTEPAIEPVNDEVDVDEASSTTKTTKETKYYCYFWASTIIGPDKHTMDIR